MRLNIKKFKILQTNFQNLVSFPKILVSLSDSLQKDYIMPFTLKNIKKMPYVYFRILLLIKSKKLRSDFFHQALKRLEIKR